MRKFPLLCATALTAVALTTGGVMADTRMESPVATDDVDSVKAKAEQGAVATVKNVAQKRAFLDTLYKAQVALHSKDRDAARKHILDADKQLDILAPAPARKKSTAEKNADDATKTQMDAETGIVAAPADAAAPEVNSTQMDAPQMDSPETAEADRVPENTPASDSDESIAVDTAAAENIYQDIYAERKVLEVEFGSTLMPEKAVMPVTDGQVTVAAIQKALNIDGLKKGALRDVDVRYIADDIDGDVLREQLDQAKDELVKGDYYGAQYDLLQIQRGMLADGDNVVPAQTRARDNISLTRYLVGAEEFNAARETINEAEAALDDLEGSEQQVSDISEIKGEVASLRKQIEKRDPSMFEKIDKKLESWWKKLS